MNIHKKNKDEKQFTNEQLAAINHNCEKDGSVIVSAAAGSGKTAVLVEHIIRIISDTERKIPADSLVTVTFTKKAAAEIKIRLEKALKQKLSEASKKNREWLNEQLICLDEARISTISAFCLDILRTYPIEAGLSPGFRNLDELEAEEFMTRAMESTLELLYDEERFTKEERNSLTALTGELGDRELISIIYDFYDAAVKQPDPETWADILSKPYSTIENENAERVLYDNFIPVLASILNEKVNLFIQLSSENKRIAFGTKMQEKLEKDYQLALDWQEWIKKLLNNKDSFGISEYNEQNDVLKSLSLLNRDCERASYGKAFNETDLNNLKENQKKYKQLIKELCEYGKLFFALRDTLERLSSPVQTLIKLYRIFTEEFRNLKLSCNAVDFNDIEHLCLELLSKDNTRIGKEISKRFYEIIIDEFQDSNKVQYEIFKAISKEKRNLFFVGDVKQSIYRFRSADPRVFTSVTKDADFNALYLNKNFRSGKEVIEAVNDVFDGLMTAGEKGGGTEYDESARLVQGLLDSDNNPVTGGEKAVAELCLLFSSETTKNISDSINDIPVEINIESNNQTEEPDVKRREACFVAKRIKEMVNSNYLIADKNADSGKRPCTYGDFAVIISALGTVEKEFLEEFETAEIPVTRGGSGDYLNLREVSLAIDLLTVIDNSYFNDIALMSVLMSPLYNMNANDIAKIKAFGIMTAENEINKQSETGINNTGYSFSERTGLFESLRAYASNSNSDRLGNKNSKSDITVNNETLEKTNKFLNDIFRWRIFAENNSPSRLIRSIYDEGTFLPLIAGSVNAEKTLANLRLLLYYADNLTGFTGLDIKNLSGFINFLSDKINNEKKLSEAGSGSNHNTVKLLTIHASKGLEFPICFVARINSAFNKRDTYADVIFDEEYGIAARYIDPETLIRFESLPHKLAQHHANDSIIGEEIRKLYVALTRARDKLILVGAVNQEKVNDNDYDNESENFNLIPKIKQNTYLEWIYNSKAIKEGTIKIQLLQTEEITDDKTNSHTQPDNKINEEKDYSNLVTEIKNTLNMDYIHKELTFIPKKLTATQIGVIRQDVIFEVYETGDEPSVFPRNPSFLKEKKLTGKKRGDAYHKVMQLIDFEAENYDKQISDMQERFTKEEYKAIEPEKIIEFFDSELGTRAVRSRQVYKEFPLYTEISFNELYPDSELDNQFKERPFVQGVADMFFYEDGEIVLVDYKTNRKPTVEKLKEEYENQLRIYKKAIEEMTGASVKECWLYSFEIGSILTINNH